MVLSSARLTRFLGGVVPTRAAIPVPLPVGGALSTLVPSVGRTAAAAVRNAPDAPTIGILTAMPVEFAAVRAVLDRSAAAAAPADRAYYCVGEIPGRRDGQAHRIVLAQCAETGTIAAADATTNLLRSFPAVSCVIMTGVAAGVPDPAHPHRHVRLGDIVVAYRGLVDYDHVVQDEHEARLRRPFPRPDPGLIRAADLLRAGELRGERPWEDWLDQTAALAGYERPPDCTDQLAPGLDGRPRHHPAAATSGHRPGRPKVHYGVIGSGDRALRSQRARDELARRHNLRAVEMEGAGVGTSAYLNGRGWFMVRGISDYGDNTYNIRWRNHAALAAATYVRALLSAHVPAHDVAT
jgi:nucleoside phosphorylase